MKYNKLSTLALSAGLLVIGSGVSQAADNHSGHASTTAEPWTSIEWIQTMRGMPTGDVVRGEKLAQQGYCYSCHGVKGLNPTQATPSLAGQNAIHTYKMLLDYQTGRFNVDHKSEVMMDLMKAYKPQQMADLAEYYAAQTLPQAYYAPEKSTVTKETIRLITKGDVSRMIVPCASCHGAKGEGGMNETPALTGMSPRMFIRHMNAYKSGQRHNDVNSSMAQFTTHLTDAEIRALADYYASFMTKE